MAAKESDIVIAKFDYKATDGQELDIQKGEKLTLQDDTQHWWKVMNAQGNVGYVPSNYVKRSKQGLFSSLRNTLGRRKSRSEAPLPLYGAPGTGGRPSKHSSPLIVGGNGLDASKGADKASVESLSYVVPPTPLPPIAYQPTPPHMSFNPNSSFPPRPPSTSLPFYVPSHSLDGTTRPLQPPPFNYHHSDPSSCHGQQSTYPMYPNNGRINSGIGDQSADQSNVLGPHDWSLNTSTAWNPPTSSSPMFTNDTPQKLHSQTAPGAGGDGFNSIGSRQLCVARFAYNALQADELSLARGDRVQVLEKSSDGWWHGVLVTLDDKCSQCRGWFPSNYVTAVESSKSKLENNNSSQPNNNTNSSLQSTLPCASTSTVDTSATPPPSNSTQLPPQFPSSSQAYCAVPFLNVVSSNSSKTTAPTSNNIGLTNKSEMAPMKPQPPPPKQKPSPPVETVLTLYAFVRNQAEELSFEVDEVLRVLEKPVDDPDWWRCQNSFGNIGLVPRNYVRPVTNTSSTGQNSSQSQQSVTAANPSSTDDRLKFATRSVSSNAFVWKPWFWGVISRSHCETLLSNFANPGEFIIRDSESHPGDLTITMNAESKNRNFKVHVQNGQYHIGQKIFPSVDALIDHYRSHPIYKNEHEKHYLTQPFQNPEPQQRGGGVITGGQPSFQSPPQQSIFQ